MQLSVITGPVNSRRLLLIRKVTEDIRKDEKTPVLYMNLRSLSFNSVNSFIQVFEDKMELWLKQFIKPAKTYKLDASVYSICFWLSRREETDHVTPMNKLDILFEKTS